MSHDTSSRMMINRTSFTVLEKGCRSIGVGVLFVLSGTLNGWLHTPSSQQPHPEDPLLKRAWNKSLFKDPYPERRCSKFLFSTNLFPMICGPNALDKQIEVQRALAPKILAPHYFSRQPHPKVPWSKPLDKQIVVQRPLAQKSSLQTPYSQQPRPKDPWSKRAEWLNRCSKKPCPESLCAKRVLPSSLITQNRGPNARDNQIVVQRTLAMQVLDPNSFFPTASSQRSLVQTHLILKSLFKERLSRKSVLQTPSS